MWQTALDYGASPSGYNPASQNTSNFLANSFSDSDNKLNDSNFSQLHHQIAMSFGSFPFLAPGLPSPPSSTDTTPQVRAKKKPNPVPTEKKNQAYYERRKKNNQSAQKSRNERRRREMENSQMIKRMEQEVAKMQMIQTQLKNEIHRRDLQIIALQQQITRLVNGGVMDPSQQLTSASANSTLSHSFYTPKDTY